MRKCGEKEGTSSASDQLYMELKPHCDTVCGVTSMGDYEVSIFCLILVGIFTLIFGLVWFGLGGGRGISATSRYQASPSTLSPKVPPVLGGFKAAPRKTLKIEK